MAQSKIVIRPEKCTGCRICELRCSITQEKVFNPSKARIRVMKSEPATDMPVLCFQCQKPPCGDICPVGAISKTENGVVVINEDNCIGCGLCVEACPFGAMFVHPEKNNPIKCDLCGGDPQCVKHCPTKALILTTLDQSPQNHRKQFAQARMKPIPRKWGISKPK
jgi:Fe-S-cluster-containing hydrogenase component 2